MHIECRRIPLKCDRAAGMRTQYLVSLLAGGAAWCLVQVVTGGCWVHDVHPGVRPCDQVSVGDFNFER